MKRFYGFAVIVSYLLCLCSSAAADLATKCYQPNGDVAPNDRRCDNSTSSANSPSFCCEYGRECFSNKLCGPSGVDQAFRRGSCTDKTWKSPDCPQICIANDYAGGATVVLCPGTNNQSYCCTNLTRDNSEFGCCADSGNLLNLGAAVDINATASVSVSSSPPSSSLSSISSPSAPPSEAPSSSSGTNHTALGIGLGVGLGAAALLAVAAVLFLRLKRKRNSVAGGGAGEESNGYSAPPEYYPNTDKVGYAQVGEIGGQEVPRVVNELDGTAMVKEPRELDGSAAREVEQHEVERREVEQRE